EFEERQKKTASEDPETLARVTALTEQLMACVQKTPSQQSLHSTEQPQELTEKTTSVASTSANDSALVSDLPQKAPSKSPNHYCTNCGAELDSGSKHCNQCGTTVIQNSPTKLTAKKNLLIFQSTFEQIIDQIEKGCTDLCPSCKSVMVDELVKLYPNSIEQAANWDSTTDFVTLAYKNAYSIAFDLLSSGNFHIHRGTLNPLSPAPRLLRVVECCLDYYVEHHIFDCDENKKAEQLSILWENIDSVG
ncbi:MAG: zinc ribbon domain-containing protein, partial [Oscillospiraceae bacterium]|nr:zinc ribbon domain-containing protein [Oscillospiraceae bacterium]